MSLVGDAMAHALLPGAALGFLGATCRWRFWSSGGPGRGSQNRNRHAPRQRSSPSACSMARATMRWCVRVIRSTVEATLIAATG